MRPACVRSCRHESRISEYSQCPHSIVTRVAQSLRRRWPIGRSASHEPSNSLSLPFSTCSFGFPALWSHTSTFPLLDLMRGAGRFHTHGQARCGAVGIRLRNWLFRCNHACSRAEWYARHASTSAALATRILSAQLAETEPPILIAANSSPWSVIRRFEQSVHSRISLSRLWYWPGAKTVGLPLRRIRAIGVPTVIAFCLSNAPPPLCEPLRSASRG